MLQKPEEESSAKLGNEPATDIGFVTFFPSGDRESDPKVFPPGQGSAKNGILPFKKDPEAKKSGESPEK